MFAPKGGCGYRVARRRLEPQGIPARVVMERLGHSNIALTLGTYSHVIPQLRQDAADAIDRVLALS